MYRLVQALLLLLVAFGLQTGEIAAQPPTDDGSAHAVTTTIDFATHPGEFFDANYYKKDGIVFTQGWFVGYFQGHNALVGPVAATLTPPVSGLSVQVAPGLQGTAEHALTAYNASHKLISRVSAVVTQDDQVQNPVPWGYTTLDLGNLPERAKYFTIETRFISSSYPQNRVIELGVSTITYTSPRP